MATSVEASHHVVLGHWGEVVKVDAPRTKLLARVSWNEDMVLLRADGKFYR